MAGSATTPLSFSLSIVFAFLLKRLTLPLPTIVGIALVAFLLLRRVPGDPTAVMAGEHRFDAKAHHARLVQQLGLDRPLLAQNGSDVKQTLNGDLGTSIVSFTLGGCDLRALVGADGREGARSLA